jgi:hypothetical protein
MSYQEKRTILSIVSAILIYAGYCLYVFQKYQQGGLELANDLSFWGATILKTIAIAIVARIIIEIAFNIINTIVTRVEEDPTFDDERDKLIELKASRIIAIVAGIGFLLSMGALVIKMPAYVMINIMFFSMNLGDILGSISQLYFYRRGV